MLKLGIAFFREKPKLMYTVIDLVYSSERNVIVYVTFTIFVFHSHFELANQNRGRISEREWFVAKFQILANCH